jgi:hypothetical protein
MSAIPDFTESERSIVSQLVERRFRGPVDVEIADAELKLDPESKVLSICPTLFWSAQGCNFVVFKLGEDRFRPQFYYGHHEHYGTGRDEYADVGECVTRLLQLQADHAHQRGENPAQTTRGKEQDQEQDSDAGHWLPPTD